MELYSRVFAQSQPLMRFLKHLHVPLPQPLKAATEVLFNTDLRWAFTDDDPDFAQVRNLVQESNEWGVDLDVKGLSYKFTRLLARAAERWREMPAQTELLQSILSGIDLGMQPDFWRPAADAPDALRRAARPLQGLIQRHPERADTLRHAAVAAGRSVDRLGYLPLLSRRTDWIALIDVDNGRIVGHAPVDGF